MALDGWLLDRFRLALLVSLAWLLVLVRLLAFVVLACLLGGLDIDMTLCDLAERLVVAAGRVAQRLQFLNGVGGGENPRKYGDGSVAFTYRLLARAGGKKG